MLTTEFKTGLFLICFEEAISYWNDKNYRELKTGLFLICFEGALAPEPTAIFSLKVYSLRVRLKLKLHAAEADGILTPLSITLLQTRVLLAQKVAQAEARPAALFEK